MAVKLPKKKPTPPTPIQSKAGSLHPATTLWFRIEAGTAKGNDGTEFELSTNVGGGNPIIRNLTNGRSWTITWKQLLDLAVSDGILAPLSKKEKEVCGWAAKKKA